MSRVPWRHCIAGCARPQNRPQLKVAIKQTASDASRCVTGEEAQAPTISDTSLARAACRRPGQAGAVSRTRRAVPAPAQDLRTATAADPCNPGALTRFHAGCCIGLPVQPILPPGGRQPAMTDTVLIIDFGSQVTQLIARRVREHGVYSEIVPFNRADAAIARLAPRAVVLSGGPASGTTEGSPRAPQALFGRVVPVLWLWQCQAGTG